MKPRELGNAAEQALERVLGYLNFSSGSADAKALCALNEVFTSVDAAPDIREPWRTVGQLLKEKLADLRGRSPAFSEAQQADTALRLTFDVFLPAYRQFHSDLLFHQKWNELFNAFFVGRVFEVVLKHSALWDDEPRFVELSLASFNDFLGYRPVATLESRKIEPYPHERVRPVPLYIEGAGAVAGPYRNVVELTLELLRGTDPNVLRSAWFDPDLLSELAYDPRAYDFDHPVNKRPNYHFGQWDPHLIDGKGFYRRFVIQQVTLDALMSRLTSEPTIPREQLLVEAAAVLCGTILMASGISGDGPEAHPSTTTLANLLPRIARYRDQFYEQLLDRVDGTHAERLKIEAKERRQPFGGARQHLNAQLARRRASQLEHVHIAQVYARMGFPESARREANVVPCASARMLCRIDCLLSAIDLAVEKHELAEAAAHLPEINDWLQRGIQCGAIVDPWNVLGFDAQFSLFPAAENSIRDHRVDELLCLMERTFAAHSRVWSEASAVDDKAIAIPVAKQFKELAQWWHQFAIQEVSSVEALHPLDVYRAAEHVAQALNLWHKGTSSAGDVRFWTPYADMFDSPKAYALVVEALLERNDLVAAQALLIHWLSQAETIGLEKADVSFHDLAERWFSQAASTDHGWKLVIRFIDYLEANAEPYWRVPGFHLTSSHSSASSKTDSLLDFDEEEEDEADQYIKDSAREGVSYIDTTDDGFEGQVFDPGTPSHEDLLNESRRLHQRLEFLSTVARLWRCAAIHSHAASPKSELAEQAQASLAHWTSQAQANFDNLLQLLDAVQAYRLPEPSGDHDSMIDYDRVRLGKEQLLDRVITTAVETADARRLLEAAARCPASVAPEGEDELALFCHVFATLMQGHVDDAQASLPTLLKLLNGKPLLYVPLTKGGQPREVVLARQRQHAMEDLLAWLPRCGLLLETCKLIEVARDMERQHPVGPGAVTEFDELFKIGYRSLVEALVDSSQHWGPPDHDEPEDRDSPQSALVDCLEQLTEAILASWLSHSRTLRLSVLERVHEKKAWSKLVQFIENYGEDLFTQRFLNLANARAILHQGVKPWLERLTENPPQDAPQKLLDAVGEQISLTEAAEQLTLVLEAVVENYGEYRDYNSTTTQSDRGELLYMLLDFLRLRTKYDRVCWNLKPVVIAHDILVRRGQDDAARMWRRALAERIGAEADQYLSQLAVLQKKYAMRMPTIADRLNERFIRPLAIDRVRALVAPALREARRGTAGPVFELLEEEIEQFLREPTGVGLDVPLWISALEDEVDRHRRPDGRRTWEEELKAAIPARLLSIDDAQSQIDAWTTR
jgi:hypothetical protein